MDTHQRDLRFLDQLPPEERETFLHRGRLEYDWHQAYQYKVVRETTIWLLSFGVAFYLTAQILLAISADAPTIRAFIFRRAWVLAAFAILCRLQGFVASTRKGRDLPSNYDE